jgi:hypothetical protein
MCFGGLCRRCGFPLFSVEALVVLGERRETGQSLLSFFIALCFDAPQAVELLSGTPFVPDAYRSATEGGAVKPCPKDTALGRRGATRRPKASMASGVDRISRAPWHCLSINHTKNLRAQRAP